MKILVVFDSVYGNTHKVAESIIRGFGESEDAKLILASNASKDDVDGLSLVVVGSPTHGGRPTPAVQNFIDKTLGDQLDNIMSASFDTRLIAKDQGAGLRFMMRLIGYAAEKIDRRLKSKGSTSLLPPEGFAVLDKEGPLKEGELERARKWGEQLHQRLVESESLETVKSSPP